MRVFAVGVRGGSFTPVSLVEATAAKSIYPAQHRPGWAGGGYVVCGVTFHPDQLRCAPAQLLGGGSAGLRHRRSFCSISPDFVKL